MKKIKMKRSREIGNQVLQGDCVYVLADSVADRLLVDGHAVFVESVAEEAPKTKKAAAKVEPEPVSEEVKTEEAIADESEHTVSKRKKK